jgi:hypothetical protein
VRLSGFHSVELSALTILADEECGFSFEKCGEVSITQILSSVLGQSRQPFLQFAQTVKLTINGNLIHGPTEQVPAVVFHDAHAVTHFTNNEILGEVSFYGIPRQNQAVRFEELLTHFEDVELVSSDSEGKLFMSNNVLRGGFTLGSQKIDQLNELAAGQANTLRDLYSSAIIQGNTIIGGDNLFVSRFLSLSSCQLLPPGLLLQPELAEVLGVMVAKGLTAVGNVTDSSDRRDSELSLVLIAKKKLFSEAGNAISIVGPV